ncbi:ORF6N domain-containing protein, partial [Salmonella enterica]|nr:ORF6N domain-containing protein [Salmonella enterica]
MAKKTELKPVAARDLQIIEYRGHRVVTTEQLAAGYGASVKNIQDNFLNNRQRFIEGKHFFRVEGDELRELKNRPEIIGLVGKNARSLTLWTERGAANHAKMLETDQAWNYFNDLTEFYFSYREVTALPSPSELSRLEILKMAIESEEGRLAAEARVEEVTTERNEAIRAKSRISRKREASALGKLRRQPAVVVIWKNDWAKAPDTQPLLRLKTQRAVKANSHSPRYAAGAELMALRPKIYPMSVTAALSP